MANNIFSTEPLAFDNYFISNFSRLSGGKYSISHGNLKNPRKEYWEIYNNAEIDLWKACRFHFEIRWNRNLTLREVNTVRVIAHIESGDYIKNPEHNKRIRSEYSKEKGKDIIIKRDIIVDFSDEKNTLNSINCILEALNSDKFQDIESRVKELL